MNVLNGLAGKPTGKQVLRSAIVGQRRDVGLAALLGSGHQAGEALVPVLIGVIIDRAVATGSITSLLLWTAVLGAVFAGLSLSYRFAARAGERAAELAAHELRLQLARRLLDARAGAETGRLSGELVNIATSDAKRVGVINLTLPFGLSAFVALVVSAVVLLRISVPLGLLVVIGLPPLLLVIRLLGIPLERRTGHEQERAAHASGIATDLVRGLRVLKGIGGEQVAVSRYRRTSQNSLAATLRAARAQGAHDGAVLALTGCFIALLALVGGRLAAAGEISVGELIATAGLALFLIEPLSAFGWVNAELAQARASAARIAAVLAAPAAVGAGVRAPAVPVSGAVALRGVGGVDLDVAAGEFVGVVVSSPAVVEGLLRYLAREGEPATGSGQLDGVPLTDLHPSGARAAILVAAHDAALFGGTLAENVTPAGAPDVDAGEAAALLAAALQAAAADQVAAVLPAGVHTPVGEGGQALSGGQRQRVALARALAADPPVLVLHDPTTAVDSVTEARIAAAMRELRRGRTTIVVTTSPALLAAAGRVIMLDETGATRSGTHAELAAGSPAYRAVVLA